MAQYNYLGNSATPPRGSIAQYMGTSDPDGWVICDGVARTNNSDGKYNNLITMGIGSGTANVNYTPPNLKSKFLLGSGTTTSVGSSVGSATITLTTNTMPAHNHTVSITDPGHGHTGFTTSYAQSAGLALGSQVWGPWSGNNGVVLKAQSRTTGITATTANTGTGEAFSIIPPATTVNYILKY